MLTKKNNQKAIFLSAILITFCNAGPQTSKDLFYNDNSSNFIIRWRFQYLCDHVYDPTPTIESQAWPTSDNGIPVRFNPKDVKPGDIIFVRNIDLFMNEMAPLIENPFIIITHGDERETNHDYQRSYLDNTPTIIAWFSIHPLKDGHERFFPLPLGILQRQLYFYESAQLNEYFKNLRNSIPKQKLLYLNFASGARMQYAEREHVKKLFAHKPFCVQNTKKLPFGNYMEEMAQCKFALSPRGFGPDCYRTWEALFVGTIPIVRRCVFEHPHNITVDTRCDHSQLDDLYKHLPILVVDEWEEITEAFLEKKYEEIMAKKYDMAPLYMEYWQNKIMAVREAFLKTYSFKKT